MLFAVSAYAKWMTSALFLTSDEYKFVNEFNWILTYEKTKSKYIIFYLH